MSLSSGTVLDFCISGFNNSTIQKVIEFWVYILFLLLEIDCHLSKKVKLKPAAQRMSKIKITFTFDRSRSCWSATVDSNSFISSSLLFELRLYSIKTKITAFQSEGEMILHVKRCSENALLSTTASSSEVSMYVLS
uniref:Uncharacterized protein n=1 Tax=Guillardia theta TaxID=55529 RepID=A0A7S4NR33_GUITH